MISDFGEFIEVLPDECFRGRAPEVETWESRFTDEPVVASTHLRICGADGVGKSALMRRLALRLSQNEKAHPLYFDLSLPPGSRLLSGDTSEMEIWSELHQELVRQLVAYRQDLPLLAPPLCGANPKDLGEFAYTSGLGDWINRLSVRPSSARAAEQTWRGILRAHMKSSEARPVLFFDGLSAHGRESAVWPVIHGALRAVSGDNVNIVIEVKSSSLALEPGNDRIEWLTLQGLEREEALGLIEFLESSESDASAGGAAERILERLQGNPTLLKHWVHAWETHRHLRNKIRRAETAYFELVASSVPAIRWKERLERIIPPFARSTILKTLAAFCEAEAVGLPRTFSLEEFQLRASLPREAAATALADLEFEGFIRRSGEAWAVEAGEVIRDWLGYHAACAGGGTKESGRPRAELMRDLLTRTVSPRDESLPLGISFLLNQFCLQQVPAALFHYGQYYEALGEIPPEKRAEEVQRSGGTLRLPEIVSVVQEAWKGATPSAAEPKLYYAHGYRDGIYRRSNEETWIVGDFTRTPTLTSLEIEQFLISSGELEREFGSGQFRLWMLAGDGVSPTALELLTRQQILCSAAEQLRLLTQVFDKQIPKTVRRPIQTRAGLAQAVQKPEGSSRKVPVIPVAGLGQDPAGVTTTRMNLAAEDGNEVIGATMAVKVAQQSGFDEESSGQIKMAVLEGCLNAIEHSPNPEKEIRLTFHQREDELEITIENEGEEFDPLGVSDPDPAAKLADKNKRGWGIKLMKEFMDDVRHEPCPGGMCLRLIKKRKSEKAQRKPSGARKG